MLIIDVENLDLAEEKLSTESSSSLLQSYLNEEILSSSILPEKMVNGKSHSFLQAMYYCYSEHRPFVLSPESIWILILQSFSAHINNDSKTFLKKYPKFTKKRELTVRKDNIDWTESRECEIIINEFCDKIDKEIRDGFVSNLTAKFSKTTVDEEIAFKITTMNTVKPFFDFIVASTICGIPKIHLSGSKNDWINIRDRLENFRGFEFDWFVDEVILIIERITKEFDCSVIDDFWIQMFKIHTTEEYGSPDRIDGWITNFFPYRKNGKRTSKEYFQKTSFREIIEDINPQIVKLDFLHVFQDFSGKSLLDKPMQMISGFIGIEQNDTSFALHPKIGWAVSKNTEYISELVNNQPDSSLIYERLDKFPSEVLKIQEIEQLILRFEDRISIPEEILKLKVTMLFIYGRANSKEKKELKNLFKNSKTNVVLNGENIYTTAYHRIKRTLLKLSPFHYEYIHY